MKKLFIIAAAAILAAACAKTYEVKETTSPAIGFGTWSELFTKARTQGSSAFASGDNFAVYGYKDMSDDSDPQTVFDDVVVSTANGTTWTYTTSRFWDSNYDKYIFYAVSPAPVGTNGTVNPQTGAITSATITFAGNDNDILVADKKQVDKGSAPYFNNYATVPLVFNHVASLVDIKVKKAPGLHDATVTVSALSLGNIENSGALSVSSAYTSTHPVVSWDGTATASYGPGSGVTPVDISSPITIAEDSDFDPTSPTTPDASTFLVNGLIVKPQTFDTTSDPAVSQKITLTYTIAVAGSADVEYANCVLYLADFDDVNDDAQDDTKVASWEPGKHYTFYITLDAHKIDFEASITGWTPVSGYNYLLN